MLDKLKTLVIDGKAVASLSIDGKTVWESVPSNVLRTVDNKLFTTVNGRYFVVEVEESD